MAEVYRCPACGCSSPVTGSDLSRCPKCNGTLDDFAMTCAGCKRVSQGQQIKNIGYCPQCGDRYPFNNSAETPKSPIVRDNKYFFGELLDTYCQNNESSRLNAAQLLCILILVDGAPFTHVSPDSEKKALTIDGISYIGFRAGDENVFIVVRASTMSHMEMVVSGVTLPNLDYLRDLSLGLEHWSVWGPRIRLAIANASTLPSIHKENAGVVQREQLPSNGGTEPVQPRAISKQSPIDQQEAFAEKLRNWEKAAKSDSLQDDLQNTSTDHRRIKQQSPMRMREIPFFRMTVLIVFLTSIGTGVYALISIPRQKVISKEDVFKIDREIEDFMVGFRQSERESDFYKSIPDLKEYPVIDAQNIAYCARGNRRLLFWQAVGAPCLGPSKMASLVGVVSDMDTLETKQVIDHKMEEECRHAKGSHTQVFGSSGTNRASSIGRVVLSADCKKHIEQVDQEQRYDRQQSQQNKEYSTTGGETVKRIAVACNSEDHLSEFMRYANKQDQNGYMQLLMSGICANLNPGAQVSVISRGLMTTSIRYNGLIMYTPSETFR